ncbi:hypothetical protein BUE80_DR012124 [Diplocarpon rosae]|nr:hypothetical protein BUE80_DR012124 [Diplocarpon rosae]
MPPSIKIPVPEGTSSMYLTALSLYDKRSQIAVSWTDGSASFGATFIGPTDSFVLADKVFGLPVVSLNDSIPNEISVSFKLSETTTSGSNSVATNVGPQGNGTQIQITEYASSDAEHMKPTTITILFQTDLRSIKK